MIYRISDHENVADVAGAFPVPILIVIFFERNKVLLIRCKTKKEKKESQNDSEDRCLLGSFSRT